MLIAKSGCAPSQRRRGLPIGNLTSQFFANIYLNPFDHFVKEKLKARQYVRYVDDFAIFSTDLSFLIDAKTRIEAFLETLRLKVHPVKSQLFETEHGISFLGFRILPDRIRVRSGNLKRGRRRLRRQHQEYLAGTIDRIALERSWESWQAHLNHGDTWRLQQQIFASLGWLAEEAERGQVPPAARRFVEQQP